MKKEQIKELLKDDFEECSEEEAYDKETNYLKKGYLGIYGAPEVKEIFFKPVQKFPIVFEGENMNFEIRLDNDKIPYLFINSQRYYNLEEKEMKSPLVHILVKHPDREEPLELSKIKFIKADKIVVTSLWANLDSEGLISKSSAIVELLRFMKVNTIEELAGKEIEAVEQSKEDLYLCLKAY